MNPTEIELLKKELQSVPPKSFEQIVGEVFNKEYEINESHYRGGINDNGRDWDFELVPPNGRPKNERPTEIWWVECKRYQEGNRVDNSSIAKSLIAAYKIERPPPPNRFIFVSTSEFQVKAIDTIKNLPDLSCDYLDGKNFAKILWDHVDIIEKYFSKFFQKYRKNSKKNFNRKRLFLKAFHGSWENTKIAKIGGNFSSSIELTIENHEPKIQQLSNIQIDFPNEFGGTIQLPECEIQPFSKIKIRFELKKLESENFIKINNMQPPCLQTKDQWIDAEIRSELEKFQFLPQVYLPFVGRKKELESLILSLDKFKKNRKQKEKQNLFLIRGVAGVGKSRLIRETSDVLEKKIIYIDCSSIRHPNLVLKAIINQSIEFHGYSHQINDVLTVALESRFNLEKQKAKNLGKFLLEGNEKSNGFQFLDDLEKVIPSDTLIVFDDLHRLDDSSTSQILSIVSSTPKNTPVILGYREDEIESDREMLLEADSFYKISIRPLSKDDINQALSQLTNLKESQKASLFTFCGGSPFILVEVLNYLIDQGELTYDFHGKLVLVSSNIKLPEFSTLKSYYDFPEELNKAYYSVPLARYLIFLNSLDDQRSRKVDLMILVLAAMAMPVPLDFLSLMCGQDYLEIAELLKDNNFVVDTSSELSDGSAIKLIHDRLTEAICLHHHRDHEPSLSWRQQCGELAKELDGWLSEENRISFIKTVGELYQTARFYKKAAKAYCEFLTFSYQAGLYDQVINAAELVYKAVMQIRKQNSLYQSIINLDDVMLYKAFAFREQRKNSQAQEALNEALRVGPPNIRTDLIVECYSLKRDYFKNDALYLKALTEKIDQMTAIAENKFPPVHEMLATAIVKNKHEEFSYYKHYEGYGKKAFRCNKRSLEFCTKYGLKRLEIWNKINRWTHFAFSDEKERNNLDYGLVIYNKWLRNIKEGLHIANEAVSNGYIEYVVESSCLVGFTQMLLGQLTCDPNLLTRAKNRLYFAYNQAIKTSNSCQKQAANIRKGQVYWQLKLHNHLGMLSLFLGNSKQAEEEFLKGLLVDQEIKPSLNYTHWMIRQNLANLCALGGDKQGVERNIRLAFLSARQFFRNRNPFMNYNFRQFYRGFLLLARLFPELKQNDHWYNYSNKDLGIMNFQATLEKSPEWAPRRDLFCHKDFFFNTH